MKREILISSFWLGITALLVGMLTAPIQRAGAVDALANVQSPLVADIIVNPITGLVTTEAGGVVTFTVILASQPSSAVALGLSTSDPTEGVITPTSLTFNPGNWDITQTVTITGTDDIEVDGDISFQIITAPAVSNDPNYDGFNPADVSVTNLDNDSIGIAVYLASSLVTTEAGGAITFTIALNYLPQAPVTIGLSSSDVTEGSVSPASLIFDSTNFTERQTVTVVGLDDFVADGDVAYQVVTAPAVSDDPSYNGLDAADVSLTNQDNDTAGFAVSPISGLLTTEAGGTDTFTVFLSSQPAADVSIGLSSSDASEAAVFPLQLTFTPSDWSVTRTVTVTGVDDQLDDGDQLLTIITGIASSGDPAYGNRDAPDVSVININDDFTPVGVEDAYLTNAAPGQPLKIDQPGVLNNDTDANNDLLTAVKMSDPQKGIVDLMLDGSLVYTPTQNFAQVEIDSFSYVANDGILVSDWITVEITIDPIIPSISWVSPVPDGEIYYVHDQPVRLQANAADNISVDQVRFFRWDALANQYIDIGVVSSSPYLWDLDTRTLNYWWNQIFAITKDTAGNFSSLHFIWIFRIPPPQIYFPLVVR